MSMFTSLTNGPAALRAERIRDIRYLNSVGHSFKEPSLHCERQEESYKEEAKKRIAAII